MIRTRFTRFVGGTTTVVVLLCAFGGCQHDAVDHLDKEQSATATPVVDRAPVDTVDPRTIPPEGVPPVPAGFDVDSALAALDSATPDAFPGIAYHRVYISSRSMRDSIHRANAPHDSTMAAYRVLTTLNRCNLGYIGVGDTIITADSIVEDLRAYSVFPLSYPAGANIRKLIVISNAMQAYGCYEYGHLVRFAAANTGRESKPTLPGRYALNWKQRLRISSLNDNWKLPFTWNFQLYAGNAFHEFSMPGRPVSHSCVRQFKEDAEWLYHWGEGGRLNGNDRIIPLSGTPVLIVDMFDYSRPKYGPWLDLTSNHDGLVSLPDAPMGVDEALIPISQVPPNVRGGLPDRKRYETAEKVLKERGVLRAEAHLAPSIDYNKQREERRRRREAAAAATAVASRDRAPKKASVTDTSTEHTASAVEEPEVRNIDPPHPAESAQPTVIGPILPPSNGGK